MYLLQLASDSLYFEGYSLFLSFLIDSSKSPPGVVLVKPGRLIDREAFLNPVLELLLLAVDVGKLNNTARLTVTILDDNDNRPVFHPSALTVRVLENIPPGQNNNKVQKGF